MLSNEFALSLYKTVTSHVESANSALPLSDLPTAYQKNTGKTFPVPISIILANAMDHIIRLSVPATGVTVIEPVPLRDASVSSIVALHAERLQQLVNLQRGSQSANDAALNKHKEHATQILLRGLHRMLEINGTIVSNDLETLINTSFFDLWRIPLAVEHAGFKSALDLAKAFPHLFLITNDSISPKLSPDFTVGSTAFKKGNNFQAPPSRTPPIISEDMAKQIDSVRAAMALLKVEMMESSRDSEKMSRLHARLSIKQKQLEDLLSTVHNST